MSPDLRPVCAAYGRLIMRASGVVTSKSGPGTSLRHPGPDCPVHFGESSGRPSAGHLMPVPERRSIARASQEYPSSPTAAARCVRCHAMRNTAADDNDCNHHGDGVADLSQRPRERKNGKRNRPEKQLASVEARRRGFHRWLSAVRRRGTGRTRCSSSLGRQARSSVEEHAKNDSAHCPPSAICFSQRLRLPPGSRRTKSPMVKAFRRFSWSSHPGAPSQPPSGRSRPSRRTR